MQPPARQAVAVSLHERERTVELLCDHFAADHLSEAELERRLDLAHLARDSTQLAELLRDLPSVPARQSATHLSSSAQGPLRVPAVAEHQTFVAVMGGMERKGSWDLSRRNNLIAVMGGAELDLREARFGPGVTEVSIFALMGGVNITVPPGVRVDVSGFALMGGFGTSGRVPRMDDPHAPVLRVTGFALMGGVNVRVRLRGETGMQEFKRRFRELRSEFTGRSQSGVD